MEIAVTVPYEIKIDAEGINLDSFDCFFTIFKDSVAYAIKLRKKENLYILQVPKELTFLGGENLKYEITVKKENAVFVASDGEITILGMVPSQFKVEIKAQGATKKENSKSEKKSEIEEDSTKKEKKEPESSKKATVKKAPTNKESESTPKDVKEGENETPIPTTVPTGKKFSFLNNLYDKPLIEQEDPNDPNIKLRKIINEMKSQKK